MKRKIHFFDQYGFIGGGQTVLIESICAAVSDGFDVELHAPQGPLLEEIRKIFDEKVRIVPISVPAVSHGKKDFSELGKLIAFNLVTFFEFFKSAKKDAIYINGGRLFLLGFLMALFRRSYVYLHLHIAPTKLEVLLFRIAIKLNFLRAIIVNSTFIEDLMIKKIGKSEKLKLVENELPEKFSKIQFRPPSFQEGKIISITPGVIRPEKGQDLVVKIAHLFQNSDFHIIGRVGEGAEEWFFKLKESAPANVKFHPATLDIIDFFSKTNSNVCLIPSKWDEPFGLVAVEGMACSCVTIVSNKGGLRSISERTGAIIFEDEKDLIEELQKLQNLAPQKFYDLAKTQYTSTHHIFGGGTYGKRLMKVVNKYSEYQNI